MPVFAEAATFRSPQPHMDAKQNAKKNHLPKKPYSDNKK